MGDIAGKVVILTGAGGNLGRAVALAFAGQTARLALVDLKREALERTRAALPAETEILLVAADLINASEVADLAERVRHHYGHIDVLVNVAGGFAMGPPLHETEDRDWDQMLNLNARTLFNTCRAVIPHLLDRGGGRIVNISARAAREGRARMGPYCASKAAVITLTETLAAEHKLNQINVNCILPGTLDTPENRAAMPEADFSRWVPPAALADVILFLASDAARAVTGAAIPVYGQS